MTYLDKAVGTAIAGGDWRQATAYRFQTRARNLPDDVDGVDYSIACIRGVGMHTWGEWRPSLRDQLVRESLSAYLCDPAYLPTHRQRRIVAHCADGGASV
jgi:hypothetical protein